MTQLNQTSKRPVMQTKKITNISKLVKKQIIMLKLVK